MEMNNLVKVTTPLDKAPIGVDGIYCTGNYIAIVCYATTKKDLTVIGIWESLNKQIVAEHVINTHSMDKAEWQKVIDFYHNKYETEKNN